LSNSTNFPLDKVFAEIRYACGLPPARVHHRTAANFGMTQMTIDRRGLYERRLIPEQGDDGKEHFHM
jgi:hypothetical protein